MHGAPPDPTSPDHPGEQTPTTLNVYVPRSEELAWIKPGAGIVGTPLPRQRGRVCTDFEGNRYNFENLRTFAQRVHDAADRHRSRYPTVARAIVDEHNLLQVATYDPDTKVITVSRSDALIAWLQAADRTFTAADLAAELAGPTGPSVEPPGLL